MLMRIAFLLVVTLSATISLAEELKATVEVRGEYLMTLEALLDPGQFLANRRVVNMPSGGTVHGPRISGTIVAPSGDWLYLQPDGSARLDVRLMIKTDDNELILMEYGGVMAFPKDAAERLSRGELLTYVDGYLLTAPRFTTGSTKYAWLNHVQAIGKMVTFQRGRAIKYDIFEMK